MCGPSVGQGLAGALSLGTTNGLPSTPGAPQLPQYPDLTPQEQANLAQQSQAAQLGQNALNTTSGQLSNNQNILQQFSGLFNADGSINQNALAQYASQAQQSYQTSGQTGLQALGAAQGQYGAANATQNAYTNALQNGAPANQQLQFQQNQSFLQMQEQAAQQGIKISGTNFSNAVSDSTAGQKLIQNFQQNANMQNQNYNLGYINQLAGNASQFSSAAGSSSNAGLGLLGYSNQAPLTNVSNSISQGQAALSPLLATYQNQLSSGYSPLYQQQIGPYQQALAQAQANYQGQVGQYNGQMAQAGIINGIVMPSASFLGAGINPNSGFGGSTPSGGGSGSLGSSGGSAALGNIFSQGSQTSSLAGAAA